MLERPTLQRAFRENAADFDDDDPPDLAYNSAASVVAWLADDCIDADEVSADVDVEEEAEARKETKEEGQTVGKLFFPGDSYHLTVKKAVIKAIGVKKLSFLVYGDKDHHNFNFWFEKDGSIFADQNSNRNSKGVDTGYRWTGDKAVKV